MNCQICNKNAVTVFVTEVRTDADGVTTHAAEEKHLCDGCAASLNIPHQVPVVAKTYIWKLLQKSARKAQQESALSCPDCGMTLAEFRVKGRLGCPKDYEVFRQHLDPLLERIHNATEHKGRLPGLDAHELERRQALTDLRAKLEEAVREEAYENAARLRDEIQELESAPGEPAHEG